MHALMQRMGKGGDKLSHVLSQEEYEYFEWRMRAEEALSEGAFDQVPTMLQEGMGMKQAVNERLHAQFIFVLKGMLAGYVEQDFEKAIALLREALRYTLPHINVETPEQNLICIEEMSILLKLCEFLIEAHQEEEAYSRLMFLKGYAERRYDDPENKAKVYPRIVRLLVPLLIKRQRNMEGTLLCREAIELLRQNGLLYDLADLMELYLKCRAEESETEETRRCRKQLQALKEVYEEYGAADYYQKRSPLYFHNREWYLMEEVIRQSREAKGLSQEQASENLCDPVTFSRMETGTQRPRNKLVEQVMKKLGQPLSSYNAELDTAQFHLLERKWDLNRATALKNWGEAQAIIEELRQELDMTSPRNQEVLGIEERAIQFVQGRITTEEFRHSCEAYMRCGPEGWKEEWFWKQFFTLDKVNVMNYIAVSYDREKQMEDAIFILEHLLTKLEKSRVRLEDHYRVSMLMIINLSTLYGMAGKYDKCIQMCKRAIGLALQCGKGVRIGKALANIAETMNNVENQPVNAAKIYLERAYYLNDLFHVTSNRNYVDKYYCKIYQLEKVWY